MAEYKKDEELKEGELPPALKKAIEKKKGKKMDDDEEEKDDDEDEDEEDDEEDKKEMKEKKHAKMKEDIDAIFSGEDLSEEFKKNAQAIFEAAVLAKVSEQVETLEEEYQQKLEEEVEEMSSVMVSKIDEYLEYVISEWAEENKVAIEKSLKAEIAEDFMVGLKNLFVENYVDLPEEKVDIVEELAEKLSNSEEELNKLIGEKNQLTSEINEYKKAKVMFEVSEGLSEVQTEKLKSLAENIEFISEEDYKTKVALTKKKYFESKEKTKEEVKSEGLDSTESLEESYSPSMERYVQGISRILKK